MTLTSPTSPSPSTPSRKRRSLRLSGFDTFQDSTSPNPYNSGTTNGTTFSRRSSRTSQTSYHPQSPVTPRPMSSRSSRHSFHRRKSSRASLDSVNSFEYRAGNGTGNLADELGEVWDQEEIQTSSFLDGLQEGDIDDTSAIVDSQSPYLRNGMDDFGFATNIPGQPLASDTLQPVISTGLSLQKRSEIQRGHQRNDSAYDGSDYGPESDTEEQFEALPPILRKRIREIEKLTRMSVNTEDTLSEDGGVVKRTIHALKDLGPQSNIEYGVTRMVTAYMSMATHRMHKQRDLFSQSHALMYGGLLNLPEEVIDLLLTEIASLSSTVPFIPPQNPLLSIQNLATQTSELSQTLRSLTDQLQESRVAANAATRKLKSVRDMVDDIQLEEELVEHSIMLIQAGDWDRRCKQRQAAKLCREVVNGFADRWGLEQPVDFGTGVESTNTPLEIAAV